jgi:hypothetical protein
LYVDGPWLSITSGGRYTCSINGDTGAYCWGANSYGRLGVGDYEDHSGPTLVE